MEGRLTRIRPDRIGPDRIRSDPIGLTKHGPDNSASESVITFGKKKTFRRVSINEETTTQERKAQNLRVLKQATVDNFPVGVRWISGLI